MPTDLASLLRLLDLETIEPDLYRGQVTTSTRDRVYGGQVAAQALVAAGRTVPDDRFVHSLHAYFIRPGDARHPIVYDVERLRDGGSFTTRRVRARQHGESIFTLEASFHVVEADGLVHQPTPPDAPSPEDLPEVLELAAQRAGTDDRIRWGEIDALDMRTDPSSYGAVDRNPLFWFRTRGEMPDDPLLHAAVITFASDWGMLIDVVTRHGKFYTDPDLMIASLDHAMWFHDLSPDCSDWLLYEITSPAAKGGRGLGMGRIYSSDGTLIVSVAQEGLVRLIEPRD